uniref:Myosin_tail_1 domain-containing protein n=1 Tax=Mesocestoides corti TaxID=53468 RepID=A0A5K3F6Y2_MESCO
MSLLEKIGETKNRQMSNVEFERLRLRLAHAEAQLAEELRYREALERDIRTQQSALQQFHIDKRIAERRKNQQFGENIMVNRPADAPGSNGDVILGTSFDVSASAITGNIPPLSLDGENLGAIFQQEHEAAQTEIQNLQTKLNDAVVRLELEEAEVCHLKEVISKLSVDLDSRDTAVVMAHEAKAAAETALQQLTDDLATIEARLQFDFSSACLITPEATSLAEGVAKILKAREQEVQSAWDHVSKMSAEIAAISDIVRLEKEVQTTEASCVDCPSVSVQTDPGSQEQCGEQANLSAEVIQRTNELKIAKDEIAELHEQLRDLASKYTQERALSARAHHFLELSQVEARSYHAELERLQATLAAHVKLLVENGLGGEEALRQWSCVSSDAAVYSEQDLTRQLNYIATHLIFYHDQQESVLRDNARLKEEVCSLRRRVDKNREIQRKLQELNETSDFLESGFYQLLRKQAHRDHSRRNTHRRFSSPIQSALEEDAQDTDADGLAFTDLSQVSSALSSFSPPLPPPSPPRVQAPNSKPLLARDRRRTDVPTSHASAPPVPPVPNPASSPHMPLSLSGRRKSIGVSVSGSPDGVNLGASESCNNENNQNSAIQERPEEIFARLAELRRRNDLQPFHLRTNYPVETQLCSPNEFVTVLKNVQKTRVDHSQAGAISSSSYAAPRPPPTTSATGVQSPAPAGLSIRPKGLQSVSEVLLTGASGIVGAERIDLSSANVRPSVAAQRVTQIVKPTPVAASNVVSSVSTQGRNLRDQTAISGDPSTADKPHSDASLKPSQAVVRKALAFEIELSPPHSRKAPPSCAGKKGSTSGGSNVLFIPIEKRPPASVAKANRTNASHDHPKS